MTTLSDLLEASAALHHHLCPRQVLGIRMGLLAGRRLGVVLPQADKRLLAIAETDGCATSGIAVATNALRVVRAGVGPMRRAVRRRPG